MSAQDYIAKVEALGVKLSMLEKIKIWAYVARKQQTH